MAQSTACSSNSDNVPLASRMNIVSSSTAEQSSQLTTAKNVESVLITPTRSPVRSPVVYRVAIEQDDDDDDVDPFF